MEMPWLEVAAKCAKAFFACVSDLKRFPNLLHCDTLNFSTALHVAVIIRAVASRGSSSRYLEECRSMREIREGLLGLPVDAPPPRSEEPKAR